MRQAAKNTRLMEMFVKLDTVWLMLVTRLYFLQTTSKKGGFVAEYIRSYQDD